MNILIYGFVFFGVAFLLHVAIWRIKKPANSIKILVLLFILVLIAGSILSSLYEFFSYVYIWFLFISLFTAYLVSYPAIEVDSPSLVIIRCISESGKAGLNIEKLGDLLQNDLLVEPRLKDLVDAGLVDLSFSAYRINKKGVMFILPFIFYRNILNLGKGG